ncbi:hypothetical protein TNCV_4051891 [Trichonephila clavipes]|nr:hypothetical protein TNCV_4051891 [Trichonephila clavipes]
MMDLMSCLRTVRPASRNRHTRHKSQNNSTKLRVVFYGSAPTTSGRGLNDILLSGRVPEDVFNMLRKSRLVGLIIRPETPNTLTERS